MKDEKFQLFLLYSILFFQGIAFAMLPALSNVLIFPGPFELSPVLYGTLFIPFALAAFIILSFASGSEHLKNYLGLGLVSNGLSMLFLALSFMGAGKFPANVIALTLVSLFLGIGFGGVVSSLYRLLKGSPLYWIVLALGMACASLLVIYFHSMELVWLAPLTAFVAFLLLFNFGILLPTINFSQIEPSERKNLWDMPWTFWLFFAVVLLYGYCESSLGVWAPYYLQQIKKVPSDGANGALAAFWISIALGRLFVLLLTRWISFKWFYALLPLFIFWILGLIPEVNSTSDLIKMCGIAGFACSAFLPINVRYGERSLSSYSPWVFGGLMSAYVIGFGFASAGLGQLLGKTIPLEAIFPFASLPGSFLTIFSWLILYFFRERKVS